MIISTLQVCLASRSPAGYRCQCDPGYEGETLHYNADMSVSSSGY